jgi:hypothetical protein
MANTAAICTSFKTELLGGIHAFGTSVVRGGTAADGFKIALYVPAGSLGPTTTVYSATNEVASAGYTAGGTAIVWIAPSAGAGTVAYTTPNANVTWNGVTFTTDAAFIYNTSQGNKAVAVYTFASQTVTAGNFTLTMPTNDGTNGLLRIA